MYVFINIGIVLGVIYSLYIIRGETLNLNNLLFHPYHTLSGKEDLTNVELLNSQPVAQAQIQQLFNNSSSSNNSNINSNNNMTESKLITTSTTTGTNYSQNLYNNPEIELPKLEISPLLTKNALLSNPITKKTTMETTSSYGSVY